MAAKVPRHGINRRFATLITGGGSGIGEASAARLAADGSHVTICGRTEQKLLDAVDRIAGVAAEGVTVQHIVADVTQEADVTAAVASAANITGRLDGLFACAGGSTCMGPLALADVDDIRSTMELNYIGTFLCLKAGGRSDGPTGWRRINRGLFVSCRPGFDALPRRLRCRQSRS